MIEKKKFIGDELFEFISNENQFLTKFDNLSSNKERILAQVAKLTEECGELVSEILINLKICRKEKIKNNSDELAKECADVLIVLFLLADRLDIDINKALQDKIAIIKERQSI